MVRDEEESLLRKEVDDIYIPLEFAKEEILKRWNDKQLRKKVETFLQGDVPDVFKKSPKAILARQILSPNFELLHFLELAEAISLDPACFGNLDDKLVVKNFDKYYLCKLYFDDGIGKRGGEKLSALRIVDFNKFNGKTFRSTQTIFGTGLVDFHQAMAHSMGLNTFFFDASQFLQKKGRTSKNYYKYFLSLFICHGVLFENYLLTGEYGNLTRELLLPNYRLVKELFGVDPLIVRGVSMEEEDLLHWRYYPKRAYDTIKEMTPHNDN